MLNEAELRYAVHIQQRTYVLLQWLNAAIKQGFVSSDRARQYASNPAIAAEWIEKHNANLPPECRPERRCGEDTQPYANMLSSYMAASCDREEHPGERYIPHDRRTSHAPFPSVENPYLRPKKVTRDAKYQAHKLKLQYLTQLALDFLSILLTMPTHRLLLKTSNCVKLSQWQRATYGHQRIRRIHGHSEGAALLVLWREFAWEESVSPKKAFRLNAEDILTCEHVIATKICA